MTAQGGVSLAVLLLVITGGSAKEVGAADPMLVIVEKDRLVFTNVPSRAEARRVPGFPERRALAPSGLPDTIYDAFIAQLGREHGLSPDLIKAVAVVESALDPHAVSPKGAKGLMQLMPATARRYGVRDPFDPMESLRAGSRHLRDLLDEFDGDQRLALAAYNAGSGAVRRAGGVPDYPETRDYVERIEELLGHRAPSADGRAAVARPRPIRAQRLSDGTVLLSN